jgi:hypothetical protein
VGVVVVGLERVDGGPEVRTHLLEGGSQLVTHPLGHDLLSILGDEDDVGV